MRRGPNEVPIGHLGASLLTSLDKTCLLNFREVCRHLLCVSLPIQAF